MHCKEVKRRLSEYVDDSLGPKGKAEIERHLRECDSCRRELNDLRKTVEMLHSLPRAKAPTGLARRVMSEAEGESSGIICLWPRIAGIAAMVAVVTGVLFLAQPQPGMQEGAMPADRAVLEEKGVAVSSRKMSDDAGPERGRRPIQQEPMLESASPLSGRTGEAELKRDKSYPSGRRDILITTGRPWDYILRVVRSAGQHEVREIKIVSPENAEDRANFSVALTLSPEREKDFYCVLQECSEEYAAKETGIDVGEEEDVATVRVEILLADE